MENKKTLVISALAAGAAAGLFYYFFCNASSSVSKEIQMDSLPTSDDHKKKKKPKKSQDQIKKDQVNADINRKEQVNADSNRKEADNNRKEQVHSAAKEEITVEEKDSQTLAAEAKAQGNKFFTSQRYEEARDMYSKAIEYNADPVYYSNRAACYSMLKDFENVVQDCTLALELNKNYVKALTRRATAYEHLNKFSLALNDYTAVCVLEGFKNEASLGATDRFLKKISTIEATELMKTKEYTLPSDTFIRAFLDSFQQTSSGIQLVLDMQTFEKGDDLVKQAFKFIQEKKWDKVLSIINEALESAVDSLSSPFEALALNLRGTFYFLVGKVDEALVDIEKSYDIDSTSINTLIKKATLYMEKTEVEKSVGIFEEAVTLDPNHPDVYYHRGQVRFLVGDFSGAASDYKKALSLDPENLYSYIQLGVAQYKLGELERTKKTFEKALKKFPKSHEVHNYYGEILLDQQKFDQGNFGL
jgi:import receptor subunit TOM70